MGNLIARVGGSGPRVQAHMDHVGYVVRHVAEDGFVLLDGSQGDRRSGPERQLPIGQPVKALTRHGTWLDGMIAASAGNVLTVAQRKEGQARLGRLLRRARARLTRGRARSRPAHRRARRLVPPMQRLADLLVGPSMDNRVGLALIDALLGTENLACEVWLGATAQEENGLHGARALALAERFALDVGLVGDIPSATRSGREPHGRLRPSRDDGMTTGTRSRKVPVFLDTSADGAENGAWRLWTDAHHGRAVLRSNLDIGLAWGLAWSIGIREEFEEPWLQNLADRKAFCQYVDVLWRGYP
jgi:putative aminopeptidase FrvX